MAMIVSSNSTTQLYKCFSCGRKSVHLGVDYPAELEKTEDDDVFSSSADWSGSDGTEWVAECSVCDWVESDSGDKRERRKR